MARAKKEVAKKAAPKAKKISKVIDPKDALIGQKVSGKAILEVRGENETAWLVYLEDMTTTYIPKN